jgi:hypothetical protein
MEFYDLDLTMFNITNMPVKDCTHEFKSGVAIVLNVFGLIYMLIRVCGWCRDPLSDELQKKIRELEEENDSLTDEFDELKDDYKLISERLYRANESLDNLRSVLDIVRPVDNVTPDTQG